MQKIKFYLPAIFVLAILVILIVAQINQPIVELPKEIIQEKKIERIEPTGQKGELDLNKLYLDINKYRREKMLSELTLSERLLESSKLKASDMVTRNYWGHYKDSKDKDLWGIIRSTGYQYRWAGENLAVGYENSDSVLKNWKLSPKHNEVLLSPYYSEVGISQKCTNNFTSYKKHTCIIVLHAARPK